MIAFVHRVSDLHKSPTKNINYFNFDLQSKEETIRAVAFKKELKETFDSAGSNKTPLKLTGFKRKADHFNQSLQNIEINSRTTITLLTQDNVDFKHDAGKPLKSAKLTSVKEILEKGYENLAILK